jgi:hypothetical protein
LVRETHRGKSQGFRIAVLLSFAGKSFESGIGLLAEGRADVNDVMPLREGDAEGLAEYRGEEEQERCHGASRDGN